MQRGAGADTCRSGAVVPGELKRGTCRKKKKKKGWIESGERGGYARCGAKVVVGVWSAECFAMQYARDKRI